MKVGERTSLFAVVIQRADYGSAGMGYPIVLWEVASLKVGTCVRLFSLCLYRMFELVCVNDLALAGAEFIIPELHDGPKLHINITTPIHIGDEYEVRVFDTQQEANLWAASRSAEIARVENRTLDPPPEPAPVSDPIPLLEPPA